MATIAWTGKTAAEVLRACEKISGQVASNYADQRAVQTLTITDASPIVITHTKEGVTTTISV